MRALWPLVFGLLLSDSHVVLHFCNTQLLVVPTLDTFFFEENVILICD